MENHRKELIAELRAKRMSFRQIGTLLGLSYQRIQQIDSDYIKRKKLKPTTVIPANWKPKGQYDSEGISTKLSGRDFLREQVRRRDNHTCQICFKKWQPSQRRLDVHHMNEKHEGKGNHNYSLDKKNLDKMITLCHKCHLRLDSVKRKTDAGKKGQSLSSWG